MVSRFYGMLHINLRNVTDLLSDGITPNERRFGKPFKGPVIPFGSMVEYYPIFCQRPVKNPSIWTESLSWIVPRIRFVRGENLEGSHIGCRHGGVGKRWTHLKSTQKDSMQKR